MEEQFVNNSNSKTKRLIYPLVGIIVIAFLIYFGYQILNRPNLETPIYGAVGDLGAKESLVPENFPLPEGVVFEQEFERLHQGVVSYTALWLTTEQTFVDAKIQYEDYMRNNGWETVFVDFGDGLGQLSGTLGDLSLSIGIRELKDAFNTIEVQVNFNQTQIN